MIVPPVIIRSDQSSHAIVQLQGRISQGIGNTIPSKLGAYGANNYPLYLISLNNEASDHQIVAGLNKGARGDVTKVRCDNGWLRAVSSAGVRKSSPKSAPPHTIISLPVQTAV